MSEMTHMADSGPGLECIDNLIFHADVDALSRREFEEVRRGITDSYVGRTLAACEAYRTYLGSPGGPLPSDALFPYIPTSVFKYRDVICTDADLIEKWCLSSGTRGRRSRVGRDRVSLERMLGSIRKSMRLFEEWHEEELHVIHLGASWERAGDVWFPYVMGLIELLYPTENFADGERLDLQNALDRFAKVRADGKKVGLIGAPFAVKLFCDEYGRRALPADGADQVAVLTAGGWKTHQGSAIAPADFRTYIADTLGLSHTNRIRDAFNQVELNTVLIECEHHRFHVPPWVRASARCPRTLAPLPSGQKGLLAYVDASAASYPCIFVGDDLGVVSDEPCPCGHSGDLLAIHRRIERGLDAGCGVALSEKFAAQVENARL